MKEKLKLIVLVVVSAIELAVGVANADMVLHWKLDETSGDATADSSGNGNSGMLKGNPVRVVGRAGSALKFDGLDDSIDYDAKIVEGSFSLALWLRYDSVADSIRPVMRNDTKNSSSVRISLTRGNTKLSFNVHRVNSTRSAKRIISNTLLVKNQWCHLVATYEASTDVASIYINGLLDKEERAFGAGTPYIGPMELGGGGKNYFDGIMDEIRIFNNALNADDVAILYSHYFPTSSRTLLPLLRASRETKAMIEKKTPQEVAAFLEKKISDYERLREKNPDVVGLSSESLYYEMHFLLAKAREAAGEPIQRIIAAYKQSVTKLVYGPNYVPALLWLFEKIPTDDYVDVVRKCVRNSNTSLDQICRVVEDFELNENWTSFQFFLDAVFSEVKDTTSYATAIANTLKDDGLWASRFSEYCRSKPELKPYVLGTLEKQAQRRAEQNKFRKAAGIYREILNQCGSAQDKSDYEFKLCKCLFESGQYSIALSELNNFIENNKAGNKVLIQQAILLKGRVHIQLDQMDLASDTFLELMIDYPEAKQTPEANFLIGYCIMKQGKLKEAEKILSQVERDFPDNSYAIKSRLCLARIKKMTE